MTNRIEHAFARLCLWTVCLAPLPWLPVVSHAAPLTTLEYRVNGTGLQVTPAAVSVPKGIAGSVLVTLTGGDATQELAQGAYIEAFLRGPGIPEPRRLVGPVNQALLFPPLNLVGDYQLDSIRLVDAVTGATRMEGSPSIVPVRVFDEVLVSRVTSRPLTYEEIVDKGIFIDESNFRVVEFEAAFVLDGKTIAINFPVVSPKFTDSVELIPTAELEEKLAQAAILNQQIASTTQLPPEFETAQLNIEVQGINFQVVDPGADEPLGLSVPPIPALMVIPGNIGYLNQFFSVQIFTENGAPRGSGLSVYNIRATLKLPSGPDRVPAPDYATPGDDPLRFARIGPDKIIQPEQQIVQPGADGELGTPDDNPRLQPSQSGRAEFLVEGLQEGLHVMDLDLEADMDGLAAGPVQVKGKAAGAVLVRNPRFSMAFSHPRTVRAGEPYEASVTLLNTGITPANLVHVTLNKNSISGAQLEDETKQTVELGTILPGQTATATYRLRSLRTGAVSFSNLTTSDDSVVGRFRLSMGVDERGVALSPDSIAMPDQVNTLPPALLFAANRVLGQALSIATAGQLPVGVLRVGRSIVTRRVLDLAEAGQRLSYGDPAKRVFADLLRDWQGGREASDGFDQILRETDAGREWREALFAAMEAADSLNGTERVMDRAADLAGLGQEFVLASANTGQLRVDFGDGKEGATSSRSTEPYALVYQGSNGIWGNLKRETNATLVWTFTNGPPSGDMAVLLATTNGTARQLRWTLPNPPADATYYFSLNDPSEVLRVDLLSDGTADSAVPPAISPVNELPPQLLAVEQDLMVLSGRPSNPCGGPSYRNYGTVVSVVFNKPMTQASAGDPSAYIVDGDNGANSVQMQPGGRVAYLNLRKGISAIRTRSLTVTGVSDVRQNLMPPVTWPIRCAVPGTDVPFSGGVAIRGRALKGDGSPAPGIPVTLTMYDQAWGAESCEPWIRRVSQVMTDAGGNFDFDFVSAGISYSISATDTSSLSEEALTLIAANTSEGQVERERILQLATGAETRDTLLGLLSSASVPEAIAKVEGLDRAILRDTVPVGSAREGQTVPVALRFRGRATVIGQVVAADSVTPVPRPAVNLFPDSGSRELGRGIFADSEGRFAFYGVPLGVYTIEVQTSDRRTRTVAGLLDTPGQVASIRIALPDTITPQGGLRGTVFEADNLTPHANARVFIGQFGGQQMKEVVRIVEADADGNWVAEDLPARAFDIVAVTFDGRRKGTRLNYSVVANSMSVANISLEDTTRVFGRVQFEDGRPASNALIAGGLMLERADASGNFVLEGVPVGNRQISAGLERNPAEGIDFPRLGSANVNVIAGTDNYVVVKLRAAGRIYGRVTDLKGAGIGGIRVAIPVDGGFYWTDADSQGNYVFENLGLGSYTLSAPANATSPQLDVNKLNEQIRSGNEDEILAAFEEAIRVFIGADDPLITGEQRNFRPITWGFNTTRLQFDGQSVEANIRMLREGTVAGRVVNHQGVPIGARVRLTGRGPDLTGAPKMTIRGERDSDPATGLFIFPGQLLAGPWTVQAASPFYPTVIQVSGFTTEIDPNVTNVFLQFPPIQDFNGRLVGHVYNPDGSPVGEGVRVKINFSSDYEIQTGTNGFFDTQILVPAQGYRVEAIDDASGLRGEAYVNVAAGITNQVEVHLLTKNSSVEVTVLRGNGQPAPGAQIDLEHGTYPREARVTLFADANGRATFTGLWEGRYAVSAQYTEGATRVSARGGVTVAANQTGNLTLRVGATGTINGRFVKLDQATPVEGAQVSVGNLGFAATDFDGRFQFEGVPLGTYQLITSDPVTGAFARSSATVTFADQVVEVLIIESPRGEINGYVIDSYGAFYVAGATVRVSFSDGLTPSRTVTTGPDGRFDLPGSPVGNFTVQASDLPPAQGGRGTSGSAAGVLSASTLVASVNIQLQPLGTLPVNVVRDDGLTPAQNVTVTLGAQQQDTDAQGSVRFNNLPLGNHAITAISRTGGELRNAARISTPVAQTGTNPPVTIRLPGVGAVNGVVLASDGATAVGGAEVIITFQSSVFAGQSVTAVSGAADGRFAFTDVPVGDYRITASSVSLAASVLGNIATNAEADQVSLRLGDSGVVLGRLWRADGATPVPNIDVLLLYQSQSANPGRAFVRSASDGSFAFSNIPVGAFELEAVASSFGGLVKRGGALTSNGQSVDLGDLRFDEDFPRVIGVAPADTATEIPITTFVQLEFSEAMETNSINFGGIYVRSIATGLKVPATLQLLETNGVQRIVRLTPSAPLVSEQIYEVLVIAGELLNGGGGVIGSGPTDLVGRSLLTSFASRFRTADNDPPLLLSLFPTNSSVQIDPRAVPRLTFNEAIRSTGFNFRLTGPSGTVEGEASVGVNSRVLSFLPLGELLPNALYTLTVSNVFDLAGNRAMAEPFTASFATLDTIGPTIATLRIASNAAPLAGGTVFVEALLAAIEPGASVRFTQDFISVGAATNSPYRVNVTLPSSGTTTLRAIATDQYGNDGPFAQLDITVQQPRPPTIQFTLLSPTNAPVPSGSPLVVEIIASGDAPITNLTAIVGGTAAGGLVTTNGSQLRVQGVVSTNASPGQQVEIFAQATDSLGLSSGQQVFNLAISDATPPALAVTSPPAQTVIEPGAVVPITVQLNDNFGVTEVSLSVAGAFTVSTQTPVSPPVTNGSVVFNLAVPANAPTNGEPVNLALVARDAAGNFSQSAGYVLRMPDRARPMILSANPADGSTGVDVSQPIEVTFSEPVDTNTVSSATFTLRQTAEASLVPSTVTLLSNNTTVAIQPVDPLIPETAYQFIIAGTVADLSGNTLGMAVTNEFVTSEFRLLTPRPGQLVVEGQTLVLEAGSATLTFAKVRYSSEGVEIAVVSTAPYTNHFVVPSLNALGTNRLTIKAEALNATDVKLAEASATMTIYPVDEDTDGDGVSNTDEIARGTDPFTPNRPPVLQFPAMIEIVQSLQTNFTVSATDVDGNLRRLELREALEDSNVRLFDVLQFTPGASGDFISPTNAAALSATFTVQHAFTNAVQFFLRAVDLDGLTATQLVSVVTLPDLNLNGIPDRDDPDIDGDGLGNAQEFSLGTDPRNPDTDGDSISDGAEASGSNGFVTDSLKADTDNDGVPDGFEIALNRDPTNPGDSSSVVAISNRTVTFSGIARIGTLVLTNGAVLTHASPGTAPGLLGEPRLELNVSNLVIDATSRIDVSGRGYLGGRSGPNAGTVAGRTFGNTTAGGSTQRNGGSFGGLGAIGDSGPAAVNAVYGSYADPNELGSGGGSDAGIGGNGGGLVRIVANDMLLDGQILANGGNGGFTGGGGAGGAIKIVAGTLSGTGAVQANGGRGDGHSGDGGGGRIAIYYTNATTFALTNAQVFGGRGGLREGTAGTFFTQQAGLADELVIDGGRTANVSSATPLVSLAGGASTGVDAYTLADRQALFAPGSLVGMWLQPNTNSTRTFRIIANSQARILTDPANGRLTDIAAVGNHYSAERTVGTFVVRHGATVEIADGNRARADRRGRLVAGSVELSDNARLTEPVATANSQFGLDLSVSNSVTVDATSRIDVSGRGYLGGRSGENGGNQFGRTLGNTIVGGSVRRSGGSYGGLGAFGDVERIVNVTYGLYSDPNEVGSGGGSDAGVGGNGGGLVRIAAASLILDGQIVANGGNGGYTGGGGSGGGIRIATDLLSGVGAVQANGGSGDGSYGGGGGGGRIAIYYNTSTSFDFANVQVNGGGGRSVGGVGTALIKQGTNTPLIVIRNSGRETPLPNLMGEHLLLDGALASATSLSLASLTLTNGAVLTHPGAGLNSESRLEITVGALVISTNSRIDVSARGYLGGRSGENDGNQSGRTLGNTTDGGSVRRSGGSYGGLGAVGNTEPTVNITYGSYSNPNEVGSGGGSDGGVGGNGGGLVRIAAASLTLDGQIVANGGNGGYTGGGGSGGGIRIVTDVLSGVGAMQANGGSGDGSYGGGGGGGRIAIYYNSAAGFDRTHLQTSAGPGLNRGGPGTIYTKQASAIAEVLVQSNGRETPLPVTLAGEDLVLDDATVSATNLTLNTLRLVNGAVLTHPNPGLTDESRLTINVGDLSISPDSRIDVSARGYLGGRSGANSDSQSGRTLGNTTDGSSVRRSGGSYGGLGAVGTLEPIVNMIYGSYFDPNELGSGGGADQGLGGNGGGLVRITANNVTLDGQIRANGGNGGFTGGGGSGGGVRITAGTLTGAGVVWANGGTGDNSYGGGGGGGRIAVYYNAAPGFIFANLQTRGGGGSRPGGAGTIYTKQASAIAQVVVRSNGRETPLPATLSGENVLVDNATVSATNLTLASLTLTNGAVLTHPVAGLTNEYRLMINAGDLNISADSRIDVSARGYLGGRSGENDANQSGRTFGNTTDGSSVRRSGGSYGGLGAVGSLEQIVNWGYGSYFDPNELGSGGGADQGSGGGNGGGLVRITANNMALDGQILANGGNAGFTGGGGSGGGIKIATGVLIGAGVVQANGGTGDNSYGGGGGGGRIAIHYQNASQFAFTNVWSIGGRGLREGTPGTLYLQSPSTPLGQLFVDAQGTNKPSRATPILSLAGSANTMIEANLLTDTNASFAPGSLVGMELNPNASQSRTFTVISNTANRIITDASDGDMRDVAVNGSAYTAAIRVGHFGVLGGVTVELVDADQARMDRRGRLRASTAAVLGGSQLTHPAATIVSQFGLELTVDDTLTVDGTSRIDVSARGYLGGRSGGNPGNEAITLGNTSVGGSTRRNGGSYGGSGAFGNTSGTVNALYGTPENPNDPGSGGGSDSSAGGSGGGVIRLLVRTLQLDGVIRANGGNGGFVGGGGSGGAIWLSTETLAGTGTLQANGGSGDGNSGGGGGGRIAIYYEDTATFNLGNVAVSGGGGLGTGGLGSVFLQQTTFNPPVSLRNLYIVSLERFASLGKSGNLAGPSPSDQWILQCFGPTNTPLTVEISTDLEHWRHAASAVEETTPGVYRILVMETGLDAAFFRIRQETKSSSTLPSKFGASATATIGSTTTFSSPPGSIR